MRIRFLKSFSTPRETYKAGEVLEWPDTDASRLVAAGIAAHADISLDKPKKPKRAGKIEMVRPVSVTLE